MGASSSDTATATFTFATDAAGTFGTTDRTYEIKVTQIECTATSR
jgi:hypothetical protein